ncbi:flagellar biosynthesis protein FlhB [Cupriavidus necator]|uniref:Flagellar biosynthetic protein FlhB n=1 Tax=Cupriavidus necator (strain ATCC 17699 / DSM 428 / KCTC 22496 / NCIMB 10442 / H16 / Stanier 337) TaxID=381666 RepID=Q0K4M1_CUPNH|nr:flagellar biosynthesis protein FlhB [Cupriavidus necator]KUE86230.1 flagellar biosynthetic protein FlhB [Cupriavidus necator]QCC02988.1 flagellar type III secretion system protein FlhB [Cupriavidus necator H16]QQB80045.1 flagellar type III secretion system protein FlhB [Cupriavidus necator]WKA44300.1 flagellar biosynthesis protein FlhB [Cupriavidus necator]CAJ95053.1 flagellar biosynthesis protein [Cupriavidus necator H16]
MSEESDLEKTEPASPRRLEKAREEGQVVRSRELATFVMLIAGVTGLWTLGGHLGRSLNQVMQGALRFEPATAFDTSRMLSRFAMMVWDSLLAFLPLLFLFGVAALAAPLLLGGWVFSGKSFAPQFSRLSPLAGLGRMFSAHSLVELLKAVAKSLLVGSVGAWVLWRRLPEAIALMNAPVQEALLHMVDLVMYCCLVVSLSLLVVAAIDVPWQYWEFFKKLRMTKEEVKQEFKESEGDPHIKGRIRQQQRAMARRRMMTEVPKADVVVTNPTHFAVALRYEEGRMGAPRVVAKGTGDIAARIRELAAEHRVPLMSAPPLARALHRHVELGQEIPAGLYTAVAEVLAWVYQLKHWHYSQGPQPQAPADLPVPDELAVPEMRE